MVRVLFIHPDLGIGGAERLVVDAALALQRRGHEVSFLTNHHDPTHCFGETADGTLKVSVIGDWIPRSIFGRFYALCAYMRMLYAAFYASFCLARHEKFDIFFCDLISIGIPVLRLAKHRPKVMYYCHFPDQLLSTREGYLKSVYRAPLNYLEELTVGMADKVMVNSKFTLRVFKETFRRLDVVPEVLYPSINTRYFDKMQEKFQGGVGGILQQQKQQQQQSALPSSIPRDAFIFLDINRYERKKNHALALEAYKIFQQNLSHVEKNRCCLVIAGGYDNRVKENVEHYEELSKLAQQLEIKENVVLLRSPGDEEKFALLDAAHCLLYTPENEHFGIVPLEGMYMSKPVIAVNSGGPTETIIHESTGFLCENEPSAFAKIMSYIYTHSGVRERMGVMGRKRVEQKFSFEAFTAKLESIVFEALRLKQKRL